MLAIDLASKPSHTLARHVFSHRAAAMSKPARPGVLHCSAALVAMSPQIAAYAAFLAASIKTG